MRRRSLSILLAGALTAGAAGAAKAPDWQRLDPPAAPGASAPYLASTAGGDLLATWIEPAGEAGARARFSRFSAGAWTPPVTLPAAGELFANWADYPGVVAEDGGSTLLAHWLEKIGADTYAYAVKLARSTDGGATWVPAGLLHQDATPAEHGFVSWLSTGKGAVAFWLDGREMPGGGPMTLRTGEVSAKALPDERREERLDAKVCDCCNTDAAWAAEGPVVAFRDRTDKEIRDIRLLRKTAGGWKESTVHDDGWQIAGCPVNGPAVAAEGRRVAVAWYTAWPKARVLLAFSEDGGAHFGRPIEIDGKEPVGRVDVALEGGDALVSWMAATPKGSAIHLRRVSAQGKKGKVMAAPISVTVPPPMRSFPRLTVKGDRLFLAWTEGSESTAVRLASLPLSAVPPAR
jgi:hypothetical protein